MQAGCSRKGSFQSCPAVITRSDSGSYLFRALDQCIKETTHIVDTGIWDVSMAKEHRYNEGIRGYIH